MELKEYLLGGLTVSFIIAFYLFSLLGVILSMLYHYTGKKTRDKRKKKEKPFNFKFWLTDNIVRFLTSVISIFIIIRFYENLHINYQLNMFLAFLIGISLDRVIIFIRNKTKINLFQTNGENK